MAAKAPDRSSIQFAWDARFAQRRVQRHWGAKDFGLRLVGA